MDASIITRVPAVWALLVGLTLASAAPAVLRAAPAAISTSYPLAAFQLAATYIGANPNSDAKLAADLEKEDPFNAFLTTQGIKPASKMAHAVSALVVSLRVAAKTADDEGIEIDPSKTAFRLIQQEAAAVALNISIDALGGRVAASNASPARDTIAHSSNESKSVKDLVAEVLPANQLDYDALRVRERRLSIQVDDFRKVAADTSTASDAMKAAAKTKLAELEPALKENRAHQAWLRALLAVDIARKAVVAAPSDDAKAKALTAAQGEADLLQVAFESLKAQVASQRAATPADHNTLLEVQVDEQKLIKAIIDDQATIASTKDSTVAADVDKNKKVIAKLADDTTKLNENRANQELLRATAVKASADAANIALPSETTKQALAEATKDLTTATASHDALKGKINKALPETKANFSNIQGYFHAGVTLLNPYKITAADPKAVPPTKMSVSPASSTDTNAFLEFVYSNRWAWNAQRVVNEFPNPPTIDDLEWHNLTQWDVQARLGYTFASGSSATANTLVGSGNFNGEVAVAKPFVIFRSIDGTRFSVGPEFVYGAVTDRSALKAHPRKFYGLAYTTSFKDPFLTTDVANHPRQVLLHFRAGRAQIDAVSYVDPTVSKEIFTTNGDLPRFARMTAGAFETELLYPIKTSTFVTFGSRVYTGVSPNPWSVQIGVTTSFGDLIDGFFK
jgi:hypothetical protein